MPIEQVPFTPPDPKCPAPAVALDPPRLLASVGDDTIPVGMGGSTVVTCSTMGTWDTGPMDTTSLLTASLGGSVEFLLPEGWRFLHWEGWDTPAGAEGGNIILGAVTPERPSSILVPVPFRNGDSTLGLSAWVISADERTVAQISGTILVRVP